MQPTNSTNYSSSLNTSDDRSPAINRAEEAVSRNLEKFELAMEHLAVRVEESRQRVESAVEHVNKAREEMTRMKDSVVATVQPFKPYVDSASNFYSSVKLNPRPYLFGLLGAIGGLLLLTYWKGKQETAVFDTTLEVHPTYQ